MDDTPEAPTNTIVVETRVQGKVEIKVLAETEQLAVHHFMGTTWCPEVDENKFTVAHKGTGFSVLKGGYFDTLSAACQHMKNIDGLTDWSKVTLENAGDIPGLADAVGKSSIECGVIRG